MISLELLRNTVVRLERRGGGSFSPSNDPQDRGSRDTEGKVLQLGFGEEIVLRFMTPLLLLRTTI